MKISCKGCEIKLNEDSFYKCTECEDYNLCRYRESEGLHNNHVMLRYPAKKNHSYEERSTGLKRYSSENAKKPVLTNSKVLPELFSDLWGHIDETNKVTVWKKGKYDNLSSEEEIKR